MSESENGNSALKYLTKCHMKKEDGTPCAFNITDSPLNVDIVGQPDAKVQRFIAELMKHSQKKHPESFQLAQMLMSFFFAWLIMGQFETQDPALLATLDKFRGQLRRHVTPYAVTDADIEGALGAMQLTMGDPHREPFQKALRHLRDYYEGKVPQQTIDSVKSLIVAP